MTFLFRQPRWTGAVTLLVLLSSLAAGCGGGGSNNPKEYTLAGRVVNGNPYHNIDEPRPGTKVIISRSAETLVFPNGSMSERYEPYTEIFADGNGNFSLRVPSGLYSLTTVPPPGGNPNDGIETPDDVCASHEVIRFPPHEDEPQGLGQNVILGHDFCNNLPVNN